MLRTIAVDSPCAQLSSPNNSVAKKLLMAALAAHQHLDTSNKRLMEGWLGFQPLERSKRKHGYFVFTLLL